MQQTGGLALFGVNSSLKIWGTKLSLTIQFFFVFALILAVLALRGLLSIVINAFNLGSKDPGRNRWYLFVAFAFYIGIIIAAFVTNFSGLRGYVISSDIAQWGQMGDFFGGMLNPILAFASFIALLYTIRIQSEELRLTRQELEKSVVAQQTAASTHQVELTLQENLEEFKQLSELLRDCIKNTDPDKFVHEFVFGYLVKLAIQQNIGANGYIHSSALYEALSGSSKMADPRIKFFIASADQCAVLHAWLARSSKKFESHAFDNVLNGFAFQVAEFACLNVLIGNRSTANIDSIEVLGIFMRSWLVNMRVQTD